MPLVVTTNTSTALAKNLVVLGRREHKNPPWLLKPTAHGKPTMLESTTTDMQRLGEVL